MYFRVIQMLVVGILILVAAGVGLLMVGAGGLLLYDSSDWGSFDKEECLVAEITSKSCNTGCDGCSGAERTYIATILPREGDEVPPCLSRDVKLEKSCTNKGPIVSLNETVECYVKSDCSEFETTNPSHTQLLGIIMVSVGGALFLPYIIFLCFGIVLTNRMLSKEKKEKCAERHKKRRMERLQGNRMMSGSESSGNNKNNSVDGEQSIEVVTTDPMGQDVEADKNEGAMERQVSPNEPICQD